MDSAPEQGAASQCDGDCERRVAELERELVLLRGAIAMAVGTLKVAAPGIE